ncbi:MAG: hypothetical protein QXE52_08270 [Candidatus Caldarchaeum sp.]
MVKLKVPTAAEAAKKFVDVTPARSVYYEAGVKGKGPDWEAATTAAAKNFKAAVSAADIDKRFTGGVKGKAGKFNRKVEAVGVSRYGPGVSAAEEDFRAGIEDYLKELQALDVPERGPRGSAGNYDRVRKIGEALNKRRLAKLAVG